MKNSKQEFHGNGKLDCLSTFSTINVPCISESCIDVKMKLNFYFHTSLWCLKRFCGGLKGLHKTFWGTTKKCENKNLFIFSLCLGLGWKGHTSLWLLKRFCGGLHKTFWGPTKKCENKNLFIFSLRPGLKWKGSWK